MEGGGIDDKLSKVFGYLKSTGKKGLEMGQSLSHRAIEVVRDPNLATNVKEKLGDAMEKTKEVRSKGCRGNIRYSQRCRNQSKSVAKCWRRHDKGQRSRLNRQSQRNE